VDALYRRLAVALANYKTAAMVMEQHGREILASEEHTFSKDFEATLEEDGSRLLLCEQEIQDTVDEIRANL
jgi:hypothetical protein